MNTQQIEAFYPLTLTVRQLFHRLGHSVGMLHQKAGISTGMRAVLESLVEGGPQTVPQMARVRPVTRQHIQGLVNTLLAEGYVQYLDNPAHKSSNLVSASERGRKAYEDMRARENEAFRRVKLEVTPVEFAAADKVLRALIATLDSTEWEVITSQFASGSKE